MATPGNDTPQQSKAKHGAKTSRHGLTGFASNLFDQARDTLTAFPTALGAIGEAGYYDAKHALGITGGTYHLDNLGSSMYHSTLDDLKTRYAPLIHGDLSGFGHQLYAKPFSFLLDATALAGGVGGVAGKAAEAAGQEAKFAQIISPTTGKLLHEYQLPRNKFTSARLQAKESLYSKLPAAPEKAGVVRGAIGHFHPDARGNRLADRKAESIAKRAHDAKAQGVARAVQSLKPAERKAVFYRLQGVTSAKRLSALRAQRFSAQGELAAAETGTDAIHLKHVQADLERLAHPDVKHHILNPTARMAKAEAKLHDLADATNEMKVAGGLSVDAAEARKAQLVGVLGDKLGPDERVSTITYSRGKDPSGKGINVPSSGTDLKSTGIAAEHALYKPDPMEVVRAYQHETAKVRVTDRLHRALEQAVPVSGIDLHAEPGRFKVIKPSSPEGKQAERVASFLDHHLTDFDPHDRAQITDMAGALRTLTAEPVALPTAAYRELATQLRGADKLSNNLLTKATSVWRHAVLSLHGSFYLNNFLSNMLLSAVTYGPHNLVHSFSPTAFGRGELGRAIDEAAPDLASTSRAGVEADAASASSKGLRDSASKAQGVVAAVKGTAAKVADAPAAIARLGAIPTEVNFRRGAFLVNLKREANALRRRDGLSQHEAIDALLNDPEAVDHIAQKVYGDLLDYGALTAFERDRIRPYYPFWNFTRAILGRTARLIGDEGWKAKTLAIMSDEADRENKQRFGGEMPDYLRGPVMLGPTVHGETRILNSHGPNIFAGAADPMGQIESMWNPQQGRASILGGINPYPKAFLEMATGQDTFTGRPLEPGHSKGHDLFQQTVRQFPAFQLYTREFPNAPLANMGVPPSATPTIRYPSEVAHYAGNPVGYLSTAGLARARYFEAINAAKQMRDQARSEAKRRRAEH